MDLLKKAWDNIDRDRYSDVVSSLIIPLLNGGSLENNKLSIKEKIPFFLSEHRKPFFSKGFLKRMSCKCNFCNISSNENVRSFVINYYEHKDFCCDIYVIECKHCGKMRFAGYGGVTLNFAHSYVDIILKKLKDKVVLEDMHSITKEVLGDKEINALNKEVFVSDIVEGIYGTAYYTSRSFFSFIRTQLARVFDFLLDFPLFYLIPLIVVFYSCIFYNLS